MQEPRVGSVVITRGRLPILVATFALWLLALLLETGVSSREGATHMWQALPPRALLFSEGAGACLMIAAVLGKIGAASLPRQLLTCAGLILVADTQTGLIDYAILVNLEQPPIPADQAFLFAIADTAFVLFIYLAWAGAYFFATLSRQLYAQQVRTANAAASALQAQNSMLRYQINPHFLFNTLNAVATLIMDRKNDLAELVLLSVSSFLRFSLRHDLTDKVSLQREIEVEELYLSIEKVRFGERFAFRAEIPDQLAEALVPTLILQPLLENAVKYAVAPTTALVRVAIVASEAAGRLQISIEDSGGGGATEAAPGLGVGLANVRARLVNLYGSDGDLTCDALEPHGFRARLSLPLELP